MDMGNDNEPLVLSTESNIGRVSEIEEFFRGRNVLVTGGTGFVGQLLVEKLLRSCAIQKLYFILRAKKGKLPGERYKEVFGDTLFDRLRREQPDFESKVVMIEGEFNDNGSTISPENRELIKDSHIVFHGAATVRFDDKLRFAVNINVRGTKEILLLCKEMPHIKAIVYIGTAFSHCVHQYIDEIFYEPPVDPDKVLALLDILNDKQLETLTPILVGEYPNTYAFSKATAEKVVQKYSEELPVCIVRPSIMLPTHKDPIPGWINNIHGPSGGMVGTAVGLLHSMHVNPDIVGDLIPADYVINNIIASAWDIGKTWTKPMRALSESQDNEQGVVERKPPIYNSVTSIQNPITWDEFTGYNMVHGMEIPAAVAIWHCFLIINKHLWLHNISILAFHIIPAAIVDTLAWLTGRKPMLLEAYKKIHKFSDVISYFATRQWTFSNDNVLELWDKMSLLDRKIFYFNVSEFEWDEYIYHHVRGIRIFLLKDPMDTVERSKKRYFKLKVLHYTVMTIMAMVLTWLVYVIFSALYSVTLS